MTDEMLNVGEEAYRQGYSDGAADALSGNVCGVNIAEGWDAYSDTFAAAMSRAPDPQVASLHAAIQHGDEEHRVWLKEAIDAHFAGRPVPEPRGKGNKEARIASLEAALGDLLALTERLARSKVVVASDEPIHRARAALATTQKGLNDG